MNAITRFVRTVAMARSSGHRAPENERVALRTAPPAVTNPTASVHPVTLPRRHGIAAAFGAAAVIFAAVALPVAFVAATVAPTRAPPEQLAAAVPSDSVVLQQPGTSPCDCEA